MTHSAIAEPASVATAVAESRQLRSPPPALEAALEAEERSIATQRLAALGEMTRGIAHDFRNLLAAVLAGLRLAEKNAGDPDQVRVYLSATREALQRGTDLTSQLLAFARHQELDAHAGDANVFLRTFEPFLRYGAGPDMTLTLHLASDLPSCLIDPAFFHAAVLNLVTNARDAMSGGGRIEISTGLEAVGPPAAGTLVRVRVQDQGPGMPPDVLAHVFDPFFTTKGDKGTGIGLSQVRAFTRMVGGHVRIDSRPGAGTAVDMLFPAVAEGRPMRAVNG